VLSVIQWPATTKMYLQTSATTVWLKPVSSLGQRVTENVAKLQKQFVEGFKSTNTHFGWRRQHLLADSFTHSFSQSVTHSLTHSFSYPLRWPIQAVIHSCLNCVQKLPLKCCSLKLTFVR